MIVVQLQVVVWYVLRIKKNVVRKHVVLLKLKSNKKNKAAIIRNRDGKRKRILKLLLDEVDK